MPKIKVCKQVYPPRLTKTAAYELAICLAQLFYYGYSENIMSDAEYDQLEKTYKQEVKKTGYGVFPDLIDRVGDEYNIKLWLQHFFIHCPCGKVTPRPTTVCKEEVKECLKS